MQPPRASVQMNFCQLQGRVPATSERSRDAVSQRLLVFFVNTDALLILVIFPFSCTQSELRAHNQLFCL